MGSLTSKFNEKGLERKRRNQKPGPFRGATNKEIPDKPTSTITRNSNSSSVLWGGGMASVFEPSSTPHHGHGHHGHQSHHHNGHNDYGNHGSHSVS